MPNLTVTNHSGGDFSCQDQASGYALHVLASATKTVSISDDVLRGLEAQLNAEQTNGTISWSSSESSSEPADAAFLAKVTQRIRYTDLASASTVNVGAALPTNAVVLGHEVALATAFAGGSNSAVKMNLGGTNGTAIVNQFDVLAATASGKKYAPGYEHATSHGDHCVGSFSAEQLVAAFTATGDTLAHLTAGDLTITVWYAVIS